MRARDWLRPMCHRWGKQKARIWSGRTADHVDGWPAATILSKIREEAGGAGYRGPTRQGWAEVFSGDGLLIQRAIQGLDEQPRFVLHVHYVVRAHPDDRAKISGVSRAHYYHQLDIAYSYIAGRIAAQDERERLRAV